MNEWISIAKNGKGNGFMADGVYYWSKLLTIRNIFYEYYGVSQKLFWFNQYRQSTITSFSGIKVKNSMHNMWLL